MFKSLEQITVHLQYLCNKQKYGPRKGSQLCLNKGLITNDVIDINIELNDGHYETFELKNRLQSTVKTQSLIYGSSCVRVSVK